MILYSYWRSTTAYRVRAALNLKGVAYRQHAVDLAAGDQHAHTFTAINPGRGVPALHLDDGCVLTQSLAIIDYLDATYPNPPLLPREPRLRARILAVALIVATDIHPVNNLRVLGQLEARFNANAADKTAWMHHWMSEGFTAAEALIPDHATTFAFSDAPTLADICLVAQAYNAQRWGLPLTPFPKIARIEAACRAHPAIAAAAPENQPDAPPLPPHP